MLRIFNEFFGDVPGQVDGVAGERVYDHEHFHSTGDIGTVFKLPPLNTPDTMRLLYVRNDISGVSGDYAELTLDPSGTPEVFRIPFKGGELVLPIRPTVLEYSIDAPRGGDGDFRVVVVE